jgi:hypothetical protein
MVAISRNEPDTIQIESERIWPRRDFTPDDLSLGRSSDDQNREIIVESFTIGPRHEIGEDQRGICIVRDDRCLDPIQAIPVAIASG